MKHSQGSFREILLLPVQITLIVDFVLFWFNHYEDYTYLTI